MAEGRLRNERTSTPSPTDVEGLAVVVADLAAQIERLRGDVVGRALPAPLEWRATFDSANNATLQIYDRRTQRSATVTNPTDWT